MYIDMEPLVDDHQPFKLEPSTTLPLSFSEMCTFRLLELVCPNPQCHRNTNNEGPGLPDYWRNNAYCPHVSLDWYYANFDFCDPQEGEGQGYHGGFPDRWSDRTCEPNISNTNNVHARRANPDLCQFCLEGGSAWHFENSDRNFLTHPIRRYFEWPLRADDCPLIDGGYNLDSDDEYRDSIESTPVLPDVGGHQEFFGPIGQFEAQQRHVYEQEVLIPNRDADAAEEDLEFYEQQRRERELADEQAERERLDQADWQAEMQQRAEEQQTMWGRQGGELFEGFDPYAPMDEDTEEFY